MAEQTGAGVLLTGGTLMNREGGGHVSYGWVWDIKVMRQWG